MFSKALLLLALYFKDLRTDASLPYELAGQSVNQFVIPYDDFWELRRYVDISINSYQFKSPNCKIEFLDGKGYANGDRLLISFVGTEHRLVINSYVDGTWQRQDTYDGIEIPPVIKVNVMVEENGFTITFKDKEYFRRYDFPVKNIKKTLTYCPGNKFAIANTLWGVEDIRIRGSTKY